MSGQFCYFIPPETQKNHKFSAGPKWEYWPESVFSVFIPNFDWGSIVLVFDAILRPAFLGTDSALLTFSANLRFFFHCHFFYWYEIWGFPFGYNSFTFTFSSSCFDNFRLKTDFKFLRLFFLWTAGLRKFLTAKLSNTKVM